ncbi:MAG: DUF547 domain-containing protein [Bdellovibrio sp.]|nr:MAG: DUF547 domain-containing protein [Bdellovibrio sp.]
MLYQAFFFLVALLTGVTSWSFDHSHALWDQILKKNVVLIRGGQASRFKYGQVNRQKLEKYINASLAVKKVEFDQWNKNQQLAYFFNLYNALTIKLVLTKYPHLKSIKDLREGFPFFRSPWKRKFFTLFGEKAYLDKIEHELVRESHHYNEPRVHFAFNCASVGCPALQKEAFVANRLDQQLEHAVRLFLSDRERNRYNSQKNTLEVSKIFDWYGDDFKKGKYGSLRNFFAQYAEELASHPSEVPAIKSKKWSLDFLPYDWSLNKAE